MTDQTFSHVQVEASLCLWEAMIEARTEFPALNEAWQEFGSVQMRHNAIEAGPGVDALYNALTEEEKQAIIPYDWEFVPAVLLASSFGAEGKLILPTTMTEQVKVYLLRQWEARANQHGRKKYAYSPLEMYVSTAETAELFANNPDPEKWVDEMAADAGLTTVEDWERPRA